MNMNETPVTNCRCFKKLLFSSLFIYVDAVDNYQADDLFDNNNLSVRFKGDYRSQDQNKYIAVLCKVRNKDIDKFANIMHELEIKMLLIGYHDYVDYCQDFWKQFINTVKKQIGLD